MKSRDNRTEMDKSAYLLEYEKRRIKTCADTFENLAIVFGNQSDGTDIGKKETQEGQLPMGDEGEKIIPHPAAVPVLDREHCLVKKKLAENRALLADNMKEMACLMNDVAESSVRLMKLGGKKQKEIVRSLAGEGLIVEDIYLIQQAGGRMEVSVSLKTRTDTTVTVEDVAGYLSVLLDMRLIPGRKNPFFIGRQAEEVCLEEESEYCCMTGAARAVKEEESVSGDNYSFLEMGEGQAAMLLSDGMGSGPQADRDSLRIIELLEQMLEAGLDVKMAVQMMNSLVATDAREDNMSTLDICLLDMYEGTCRFLKAGAASSFLKHGTSVERIPSETLPLGVFGQIEIEETERLLADGDAIILVSDGVLEGWPGGEGEFFFQEKIAQLGMTSPVDMANSLLKYVIGQCRGQIRDDMTILVARVWESERE